jgi:hypothetical protein
LRNCGDEALNVFSLRRNVRVPCSARSEPTRAQGAPRQQTWVRDRKGSPNATHSLAQRTARQTLHVMQAWHDAVGRFSISYDERASTTPLYPPKWPLYRPIGFVYCPPTTKTRFYEVKFNPCFLLPKPTIQGPTASPASAFLFFPTPSRNSQTWRNVDSVIAKTSSTYHVYRRP